MTQEELTELTFAPLDPLQLTYERFKNGELILDEIGHTQKVNFLIMLRTEKKTIEQLEEDIKSSLLEDTDFQKADVE